MQCVCVYTMGIILLIYISYPAFFHLICIGALSKSVYIDLTLLYGYMVFS